MRGSSTPSPLGNYGTKGVAAATNEPPGRYQGCFWTDKAGDFWLFGGGTAGVTGGIGNDLWKYDVSTNMWTWINGPNCQSAPNPAGVYGTKGIPSPNNYPAARGFGADCWTDNNGDLWLFGGYGGYDDLWKYNIASNQWTWVSGSQTVALPVFGTMGTPASTNTPGRVSEVKSGWVDAGDNLWMFGGQTNAGPSPLWKYDIASDTWTWMSGSTTTSTGSYGTYRVEAAANQPPTRLSYTRWRDPNDNMYVFGGAEGANKFADVWRYRPSTGRWTWISGSSVVNDTGRYPPQQCQFFDGYYPTNRMENQTASSDDGCSKAFWSFGGWGGGSSNLSTNGTLNDLWLFSTDNFKWSWISGSKQHSPAGNFGTRGVRAATNMPPGKDGHAMWVDPQGALWVFGGISTAGADCNDLWRFEPDTACISKYDLFIVTHVKPPTDTVLCPGDTSILNIGRHKSVTVVPFTGVFANADTSVLRLAPTVTTGYKVYVKAGGCTGEDDTLSFTMHLTAKDTVKLTPPAPLLKCAQDSLRMTVKPGWTVSVTPSTDVTYRTTGGTQIVLYPRTTTTYTIRAESSNPCRSGPDSVQFTIVIDTGRPPRLPLMLDTFLCQHDTAVYVLDEKLRRLIITPRTGYRVSPDSLYVYFYPDVTTKYQLLGTRRANCGNVTDTLNFFIHRSPVNAGFEITPPITDQLFPKFDFKNTSFGATRYEWYTAGQFWTAETNPSFTGSDTGTYCFTLLAFDDKNCVDTAIECGTIIHTHIAVPSAFSPNGDGKNDFFHAVSRNVNILELAVYNRFGQRVFIGEKTQSWDGTFGGKPCDVGTYFYFIRYQILNRQERLLEGDVTLIR
jgi:gliding motility-associated-like protein